MEFTEQRCARNLPKAGHRIHTRRQTHRLANSGLSNVLLICQVVNVEAFVLRIEVFENCQKIDFQLLKS